MRLRDYMPQTLMGRSLLIMVLPVILAQIFAVTFFWDNHWDKVTKRLADALSGEVAIISDQLENNYSDERYKLLQTYLKKHLDIELFFEEGRDALGLVNAQQDYGFYKGIIIAPLITSLNNQLAKPHNVLLTPDDSERIIIQVALSNGFMTINVPEKRLFSSSGYVFVILLVLSSFTLLIISILFLRNQIRPIRRLAAAASLMGKGRVVNLGSPRGAREVRQAWEAFETMQRRIRRQLEQRTAMLAGVSHDMRTPLTRIKLGLSMLDDQKEASQMMEDLDEMEKMVDAYLEFARGEKLEDAVAVNIRQYIEDIINPYKEQGFNISFIYEGYPDIIELQKVNFRRCLENIIGNATHYTDKIKIKAKMTTKRFFLTIEDNGPGIEETQYEEVFKPFVRLDPSRNKHTGGAGLGLSVAMDIVMAHGGKISLAKSKDLKGLLVSIRLPV